MIIVSNEFKQYLADDKRDFYVEIGIMNGDSKVLNIDNSHLWENSFLISDGVSESNQFTIGSCKIKKLIFTLNNMYDEFSDYNFHDAIISAVIGLRFHDNVETVAKGVFIVKKSTYNGTTITLECVDNMASFDVDYKDVKTEYPASIEQIVSDICSYCKVTLSTPTFDDVFGSISKNKKYIVDHRPDDETLTCRQMLSYCAQIACKWARIDKFGRLELGWYDKEQLDDQKNLDGGFFDDGTVDYTSGDTADGGTFDDYSFINSIDGGTFDDMDTYHHLYSLSDLTVSTDEITITGIKVTENFAETEHDKCNTVFKGTEGYVLSISGNKLIQRGQAETVASYLSEKLTGFRFRPISAQVLCDPTVEAGDVAFVTDSKQNTYNCLVSNLIFNLNGYMTISCDAKTHWENHIKYYSEMTQAVVQSRKNAQAQINEYNTAVQQLTDLITNSFGIFKTEERLEDGSVVFYMHDKPSKDNSQTIWRMTADAFEVSTDGGRNYRPGMDSSGNEVENVLSTIGITYDWLRSGTLNFGGSNNTNGKLIVENSAGTEIGRWDANGLNVQKGQIKGSHIELGSSSGDEMLIVKNTDGTEIGRWDVDGLNVQKGQIKGSNIELGSVTGNEKLVGYRNGNKAVELNNISMKFYSWKDAGNYVGTIESVRKENGRIGMVLYCDIGDYLALGSKTGDSADGSTVWSTAIEIDANDTSGPPSVRGTKSGRAEFSDGSYLDFKNGFLVGGQTVSGSSF